MKRLFAILGLLPTLAACAQYGDSPTTSAQQTTPRAEDTRIGVIQFDGHMTNVAFIPRSRETTLIGQQLAYVPDTWATSTEMAVTPACVP